jgi:hypothetical protein
MALLIESTNGTYQLPDKGILGPHAIFDRDILLPDSNSPFDLFTDRSRLSGKPRFLEGEPKCESAELSSLSS